MTTLLDASAAIAWCMPDEFDASAEALLTHVANEGAIVPALWAYEVENALRNAHRRSRLTVADALATMTRLRALPIRVVDAGDGVVFRDAFTLAVDHAISVYDAVYLDTARRHGASIASRDERLLKIAETLGIPRF